MFVLKRVSISIVMTFVLFNFLGVFYVSGADELMGGLFEFVCDDLGCCHIVSDNVFSLDVYAVNLVDVGNYRVLNHSALWKV